jgi:predicted Zn-dependent protease
VFAVLRRLLFLIVLAPALAAGAPFTPSSDQQVLERLPARATEPQMRELRELRRQLAADPRNAGLAVRLARRYYDEVAAEGDPRYVGYAQAALAPWWNLSDPPIDVRVTRAVLLQFNHQFDPALADLDAAIRESPTHGEAWSWHAAIDMVRARYASARNACQQMAAQATPLIVAACIGAVDGVTGKATAGATAIRQALRQDTEASAREQLWALTRLAEIEDRRGDAAAAEATYRQALALGITDGYLLAAYADFLLDHGRPAEVLPLLKSRERSDLLLLRLAIAAQALNDLQKAPWTKELAARFDAARMHGDTVHQKEESRFALALLGQSERALALAVQNYEIQREPADARILLEAALAAKQPAAAEPVLKWMAESGIESGVLHNLAVRLKNGS